MFTSLPFPTRLLDKSACEDALLHSGPIGFEPTLWPMLTSLLPMLDEIKHTIRIPMPPFTIL